MGRKTEKDRKSEKSLGRTRFEAADFAEALIEFNLDPEFEN